MNAKPWAIYTRVSTDDQAREGVSLDVQRLACGDLLKFMGLPVGTIYEDAGHSAKDLHRPAAERLLAEVDAGNLGGVIVYKLDRLTRSVIDLFELLKRFESTNTSLVSVREKIDTTSAMGRFFVGMIGLIAQWEREQISERVTAGMNHRRAQGGFIGGPVPSGLQVEGNPGSRELVLHPDHAPIVAEVWPRLLNGASLREVAAFLKESGVKGQWTIRGVHALARNEKYIGRLVDQGTFDASIAVMAGRMAPGKSIAEGRVPTRQQTHTQRSWPLSGLAKCGRCGSALVGVTATNGSGTTFPYLRCGGRVRKGKDFCGLKDQPAEVWEGLVIQALIDSVKADGDLLPAVVSLHRTLAENAGPLREQLRDLTMVRDGIAQQVKNLATLAAEGGATARGLAAPIAQAQEAREALELRMATLEAQMVGTELGKEAAAELVQAIRDDLTALPSADLEEQAETLKQILAYVVIRPAVDAKQIGEIDLAINLPRVPASSYETGTMVVNCSSRTNKPRQVIIAKKTRQPTLREWRAGASTHLNR